MQGLSVISGLAAVEVVRQMASESDAIEIFRSVLKAARDEKTELHQADLLSPMSHI